VGNPAFIVWYRTASLGEEEIPRLVGARFVFDPRRIDEPISD
jgi:hypothetical protein